MRGDHDFKANVTRPWKGLPPRARGSRTMRRARATWLGPTPACAGITPMVCACARTLRAYPRVRGDHLALLKAHKPEEGLPPRARGSLGNLCPV